VVKTISRESISDHPFADLPQTLVEDMLKQCGAIGNHLSRAFNRIFKDKDNIRRSLSRDDLLKRDSDISYTAVHPTTCGVDGSYTIEKLLSTDLVAIAGVAIEGLTPPTEKRYWPRPNHLSDILSVSHSNGNSLLARAIMMCMELELAVTAPHDVVFLDGSLATPFIHMHQAIGRIDEVSAEIAGLFNDKLKGALTFYLELLSSKRSDKIYTGVPKYTTQHEITRRLSLPDYEDRSLLSFILEAGEYISPLKRQAPHGTPDYIKGEFKEIKNELMDLYVVYYRPYNHFPALRLELSSSVAFNQQRLAILFESIKLQCGAPGILEPYPLYLADRMVKHLRVALPAIRKASTQEMSVKWEGKLGDIYLAMHGYRTEWG